MAEVIEKEKEKKPLWRRITGWIMTVVVVGMVGFFAAFMINGQINKDKHFGVNMFLGTATLVVQTDSMEPLYPVGSAIFVKNVEPSTIQVEDDVTFFYKTWGLVVTHRVSKIELAIDPADNVEKYFFTVHGINKDSQQCADTNGGERDCTDQTQYFSQDYLIGKVTGKSVAFGKVYGFFTTIWGLIFLLAIPAGYLITTSVIDIVKAAKMEDEEESKPAEAVAGMEGLSPEDIARLKEEMLNEIIEQKQKELLEKERKEDETHE